MNADLHQLMPQLPADWVLVHRRPKKEKNNGQAPIKSNGRMEKAEKKEDKIKKQSATR